MTVTNAPDRFSGNFVGPDDPTYEEDHKTFVWMMERRPAVIAHCATREDVALALRHGLDHGLEIAVRSGRHSVPGFSSTDGGILIDVSALEGLEIDRDAGRARVEAGVLAGRLLPAAVREGFAPVSGSESFPSFVGLAIHGGRGLFRRHGWASDRILSAELVTLDGKAVRASADENPELLYGIRGAGSNFGIVTELEVELVPIPPKIRGGKAVYERASIEKVVPAVLEGLENGQFSDGLGVILTFFSSRDDVLLELTVCHIDDPDVSGPEIERLLKLGQPIEGGFGLLPYDEFIAQTELIDIPRVHWAEQGSDVPPGELASALIREVDLLPAEDSEMPSRILTVEPLGPGFSRETELPTPVPRRGGTSVAFFSAWTDPEKDEEMIGWARGGWARFQGDGFGNGVPILNYNSWTGPEGVERAYGTAAYGRLQQLKRQWDPENVFHRNHNVLPAG